MISWGFFSSQWYVLRKLIMPFLVKLVLFVNSAMCKKYYSFIYCILFNHLWRNSHNTQSLSDKSYTLDDKYDVAAYVKFSLSLYYTFFDSLVPMRKNVVRNFFPSNIFISNDSTIIVCCISQMYQFVKDVRFVHSETLSPWARSDSEVFIHMIC